ncbi:hypothetical protein C8J25_101871 [Sphingomonas faeni]|uniref:Tail length tape measure protein n=1 Tax=Sphingomonas faeni TaxID=185950 RepID=A0A2T5UCZ3_9SPHN|nr:hypothetical protein [Sphingomonas faeni]PTW49363.1 hypothetical protein C8J25_101871 [Sphingomonas faeni]
MANLGSLFVNLALESAQFIAGMRNAAAQSNATGKAIAGAMNIAKGAIGGLVGVLSVDFLASQTMAAFDYADAIVDISTATGATTRTIQEFRYAAQLSGSSVENADAAIGKFSKNLGAAQSGNKAMAASFKALGVDIAQGVDPALRQFMDGVAKLPTVSMRVAAATGMMGKSAADLTPLLGQGSKGFDTLAAAAQAYGIVIEDSVLQNAGVVNDKLDTMKMILDAQMANAIVQNADALMTLANSFMSAAAAAANFFSQMDVNKLMSVANGVNINSDIPTVISAKLRGQDSDGLAKEAREQLNKTHAGRQARHDYLTKKYNENIGKGRNKNDMDMQAIAMERQDIARAERRSKLAYKIPPAEHVNLPGTGGGTKPKPAHAAKAASSPHLRSAEEIDLVWRREFLGLENELRDAQADLTNTPTAQADAKVERLQNDWSYRASEIDHDTGTDQEIAEGKKRYTALQAQELHAKEQEIFNAKYDLAMRDRDSEIARDRLAVTQAGLQNEQDDLAGQAALARSTSERRKIALKLVDLQYQQEQIALDAIIASKDASQAEKDIAAARKAILPKLRQQAVDGANKQTQGPLAAYMDSLPGTVGEISDQMESIQVEGLEKVQEGILGIIDGTKSMGDMFGDVTKSVLSGLARIAIQQAIIKPLGNLLFGGGDGGGGGILGSVFGGIMKGISGKRANGGMTQAGDYLVGERGPEVVRIGASANVMSNTALRGVAGANDNNRGPSISIGSITSNDPVAVRRMVIEGIAQAIPTISEQATNRTMKKLGRRTM